MMLIDPAVARSGSPQGDALSSFSVVIEWENVLDAGTNRAGAMLRELRSQIIELAPRSSARPDILIVYDPLEVAHDRLSAFVDQNLEPGSLPAAARLVAAKGRRYYEQKNDGAAQATGEVLVFIDSDVIPEEGWLRGLVEPFRNPQVCVVAGTTYISLDGFFSRAFQLFWFFDLRDERSDLAPTTRFHANNVAFRRENFLAYPYPKSLAFNVQGNMLWDTLQENGIALLHQHRSRAGHPPPSGLRHFVCRALCHGHDELILRKRRKLPHSEKPIRCAFWTLRENIRRTFRTIRGRHREVGLGTFGAIGAAALSLCYYSLAFAGQTVSAYRPELIRRYFPI
jgi:hypothetical protein